MLPVVRRAALAIFVVSTYLAVDAVAPLALSRLDDRHDPLGGLHLLGVVPLALGLTVVVLAGRDHARAWRMLRWRVLRIDRRHLLTPDYLVTTGLYARSRNPLYVGDVLLWSGWAVLLGSLPVAIGTVVLAVGLSVGVRLEERGLARRFGEQWTAYCRATPRFVRLRR